MCVLHVNECCMRPFDSGMMTDSLSTLFTIVVVIAAAAASTDDDDDDMTPKALCLSVHTMDLIL